MTIDKQNIDEKHNMVLTEKQQKYQHYNQVKFLLVRKRYVTTSKSNIRTNRI